MPPEETKLTDETAAESSTATQSASDAASDNSPTMADVAKEAYEKSQARSGEEATAEGDVQKQDTTEKKDDATAVEKEERSATDESPTTDETPLPFDKHPRWVQRTKEYNDAKAKLAELEATQKAAEPQLQQWQYHQKFLQQYGIPEGEVAQMMNFLALMRQDPLKARDALRPMWESLSGVDPNILPTDLQKSVTDGEITEAHARRLWAAECKAKSSEQTGKFTSDQIARRQAQARSDAVTAWDMSKRKTEPDFRPKINGAKDGLWEWTAKAYSYKKINAPENASDVELLEAAFAEAKEMLAAQRPPAPNGRTLTSSRSSGTNRSAPKSIDDVVATVARSHGIEWSGRNREED